AAPDTTSPVISNVRAENITTSSAQIKWTTDEQAGDIVWWDTNSAGSFSNISQARCTSGTNYIVTDHCINLTNLSSGITYYYKVESGDASSNKSISSILQFTTLSAAQTTTNQVQGVSATVSGSSVSLSWSAVTTASIGVYNIYRSTAPNFSIGSGYSNLILQGNVLSYTWNNVSAGTYYYKVAAQDVSGTIYTPSSEVTVNVSSSSATTTSAINTSRLSAISQMINSLEEILKQLSQILK
ncbi:MAG: fibronectin type III domain-containing protein, partial [Patescibacteria group bacterium]